MAYTPDNTFFTGGVTSAPVDRILGRQRQDQKLSPYIHPLVIALQSAGHKVSVVLPHVQRSWISKAHNVGHTITPTYYRPGTLLQNNFVYSNRPFNDGGEEWVVIDGTPASCVDLGLHHLFQDRGPIDLVVGGPNYGRNTTSFFVLSSGTLGAALEGAVGGKRSIALSYAFTTEEYDVEAITEASKLSVRIISKLVSEWPEDVHVYNINVPVHRGVTSTKIMFTGVMDSQIRQSPFQRVSAHEGEGDIDPSAEEHTIRLAGELGKVDRPRESHRQHCKYKWAPRFEDVNAAVAKSGPGEDGWEVVQGNISVTPIRANYWHLNRYKGEIEL